jgi:hypothetical protein
MQVHAAAEVAAMRRVRTRSPRGVAVRAQRQTDAGSRIGPT